jgi:hypothetical protein
MRTLTIKDLSVAEQLDRARMCAVLGGRWKEERPEILDPRETYGPGGVNQGVLWNNGIDGPIIIWDRDGTNP